MDSSENSQYANHLLSRISQMKQNIKKMRKQLNQEKEMLHLEKSKINQNLKGKDLSSSRHPNYSTPFLPSLALPRAADLGRDKSQVFPKQDLQEIEEKCGKELVKLDRYIDNIRELKKYWKETRAVNNTETYFAVGDAGRQ